MTTIAYRDGYVAADSASWREDTFLGYIDKILVAEDGTVFTGCGAISEVRSIFEAYEARQNLPESKSATTIQFHPKKRIMEYIEDYSPMLKDPRDYMAWGSGYKLALGAMAAGATAEEAVKAAVKHDAFTAGKVKLVKV